MTAFSKKCFTTYFGKATPILTVLDIERERREKSCLKPNSSYPKVKVNFKFLQMFNFLINFVCFDGKLNPESLLFRHYLLRVMVIYLFSIFVLCYVSLGIKEINVICFYPQVTINGMILFFFLNSLVCVCVVNHSVVSDSVTLWTAAHQPPLSVRILQIRILEWIVCSPPADLPNPGTEPRSPTFQADSLPSEPPSQPL